MSIIMPSAKPRLVNLELDLIRAFIAVAEAKSFTRAGTRLGRTQSTVSLQIQRLEEQIGAELFSRDPRRVVLTAHGEQLLAQARALLRLNDEIVGALQGAALEARCASARRRISPPRTCPASWVISHAPIPLSASR